MSKFGLVSREAVRTITITADILGYNICAISLKQFHAKIAHNKI